MEEWTTIETKDDLPTADGWYITRWINRCSGKELISTDEWTDSEGDYSWWMENITAYIPEPIPAYKEVAK